MPIFKKIRSTLRSFCKDEKGVAAIEFAAVIPLILLILIPGGWEASTAYLVKQKVRNAATSLANLGTQVPQMDAANWAAITSLANRVLEPYTDLTVRHGMRCVEVDSSKRVRSKGGYGLPIDVATLPAGLIVANSFYIMTVTEVDYEIKIAKLFMSDFTVRDTSIMIPRLTSKITCKA